MQAPLLLSSFLIIWTAGSGSAPQRGFHSNSTNLPQWLLPHPPTRTQCRQAVLEALLGLRNRQQTGENYAIHRKMCKLHLCGLFLFENQSNLSSSITHLFLCPHFGLLVCPTIHKEVGGIEQGSCQTCRPWGKIAGDVWISPHPPTPHTLSCSLGFKLESALPLLPLCDGFVMLFCPNKGKGRKERAVLFSRSGSSWLMLLPRSRRSMKGPLTPTALPMAFTFPVSV